MEVRVIRGDQIDHYGGSHGERDPGLLEAAALWESLGQNHPFIDGNKRTAFAVTYTFLAINGARITADADETYDFIIGLHQTGTFEFERLAAWLRANTVDNGEG